MGLFSNYEKIGPGVSKDPDNKIALFRFLDIYTQHFAKLIILNFIFLLAFVPFCGIMYLEFLNISDVAYNIIVYVSLIASGVIVGPCICGFMKVLRNISCRRPVFIWSDYWRAFAKNFKQGAIIGVIDMFVVVAMSFAIPMYSSMAEKNSFFNIPFIICIVVAFIFVMMHFYVYLLIVSTNLTLWNILKNSLYLTAIEIKTSVINLIVTVILLMAIIILFPYSTFAVIIVPSFLGLLYAFNCFPAIRKHVIKPYYDERGEQMPDLSYTQPNGEEALFTDTPETEIPQEQPKQKRRGGRRIS